MRVLIISLILLLAACTEVVPPANMGKRLTTAGYEPEVLNPGRHYCGWRCTMVLLDTSTSTFVEPVDIIMDDKLTLKVDVRFRGRIAGADKTINSMFNDIKAGRDNFIAFEEVYKTYGKPVIRNKTREIISKYNMEDVHRNYTRISAQIAESLVEPLSRTPLEISEIVLGGIEYPKLVTESIEQAQSRRLAIEKEKAQAEIDLTKKDSERRLAEAEYQIQITKAKAIRDQNKIIADGVTPELLEFRRLDILEQIAKSGNQNAVYLPLEALSSTGAQVRMFQDKR